MASNVSVSGGPSAPNATLSSFIQLNQGYDGQNGPASAGTSRKKQKKRQKKVNGQQSETEAVAIRDHGHLQDEDTAHTAASRAFETRYGAPEYDLPGSSAENEDYAYSDDDLATYNPAYPSDGASAEPQAKKKSKKKKKGKIPADNTQHDPAPQPPSLHSRAFGHPPPPPPPPPISHEAFRTVQRRVKDPIWDTSTQEERSRIKEFWLSLGEDERKSLVKIEKEAVLRKMKEQQKHSCSCTVCGRKRTAIEEELEVLYDAYYEELEQFANHNHQMSENGLPLLPPARRYGQTAHGQSADRLPPAMNSVRPSRGRIHELPDDEDDLEDEDVDEQSYSDEDDYEDEDYSADDTDELPSNPATDFFTFGNSLTVKGGILTVADDLLKNDGQKFIDMMEQLAERRMQREEEASNYAPYGMSHQQPPAAHAHAPHTHGPPVEDEYDDEEDEVYDSQDDDYDEEEEDDMDAMTEEQRMEEGRRMFQIFAARMFEQRVLTAYREKVARERQEKLIQELEAETLADVQRDAKKARDAEKKKQKKQQQKQAKAEEKARKDEQKAAEEAAAREAEAKRIEEQRQKREEQKKKKEAERKAQEEEKQRKEAEKQRRIIEERERQQEVERKAREQKAEEKKRREDAKRKEKEEKEAQEKERQEQRAHEENERRDREERLKAEQNARERLQVQPPANQQTPASLDLAKRASAPPIVAVPPVLKSRQSMTGQPSPQTKIATPVLPKPPTPVRPKEPSGLVSRNSTPHTPESGQMSKQSTSPKSASTQHSMLSSNLQATRTPVHPPVAFNHHMAPLHALGPPPGMHPAPSMPFIGMPPSSMNGFPGTQPGVNHSMLPRGSQSQPGLMFPPHAPYPTTLHRPFMQAPLGNLPPSINHASFQNSNRAFGAELNPGLSAIGAGNGPLLSPTSFASQQRENAPGHQRQGSVTNEAAPPDAASGLPISRPAPIKRPASKVNDKDFDMNDLSNHLGSSALLDDSDDPLPSLGGEPRRPSAVPTLSSSLKTPFGGSSFEAAHSGFARRSVSGDKWSTPLTAFGGPGQSSTSGWGGAASTGWSNPAAAFHHPGHRSSNPRPVTVRLLACQALRTLSSGANGGFHEIGEVLRQADSLKTPNEAPVRMEELRNILDTEGDAHNGGGYFLIKGTRVKWEADASSPGLRGGGLGGLGEIGSPIPGNSLPALSGLGARGY